MFHMSDLLSIGDAVLVTIKDQQNRIASVRYIGVTDTNEKYIGLNLIEEITNGHDGTVNGVHRFSATPGHGIVVGLNDIIQKLSSSQLTQKLEQIITLCSNKFSEYLKAVTERDEFIESLKETIYSLKKELKAATKNRHLREISDTSSIHLDPPTALTHDLSTESIEETVYDFTLMSPVPRKAGRFFNELKDDLKAKKKRKLEETSDKKKKSIKKIHIEKHCEYTKWKKELSALSSVDS